MGQIKNIKLHIVTDIKRIKTMTSDMTPRPQSTTTAIYQLTDNCDIKALNVDLGSVAPDLENLKSLKDLTRELEKYETGNKKQLQPPPKKKKKVDLPKVQIDLPVIPSSAYVSQERIFSVLQNSISNEKFWSESSLRMLLENKYIVPGHNDDVVFNCIIKYKSFSLLKLVAQNFHIVTDKHVIRILSAILNGVTLEEATAAAQTSHYYSDCPVSESVVADLSYAMVLPVNKTTLSNSLKVLTLDESLILLQCLVFMLHVVSPALAKDVEKSSKFDDGMTEGRIVLWLDALLTAQLMSFATSHTMEVVMPDIKLCIQKQQNYYSQIAELASFLQHMRNGKSIEKPVGLYTIENISL